MTKRALASVLALAAVMSLASCGDASSPAAEKAPETKASLETPAPEETSAPMATPAALETTSETEKTTSATTVSTEPETTTEEETSAEPAEDPKYSYYELINEEYENDPQAKVKEYYYGYQEYVYGIDDKIYISDVDSQDRRSFYIYDIESKELKQSFVQLDIPELYHTYFDGYNNYNYGYNFLGYYNGRYYFEGDGRSEDDVALISCNLNGEDIKQITDSELGIKWRNGLTFKKGYTMVEDYSGDEHYFSFLDPDLNLYAAGPIKSVHGIEETVYVSSFVHLFDKLFANCSDIGYVYDESSGQWEENTSDVNRYDLTGANYYLGRYYFDDKKIIDAYTGEMIAKTCYDSKIIYNSYFGGDNNIIWGDDYYWYKAQIPSDGSNVDFSLYEKLGGKETNSTDGDICRINDKYYILIDDYGIFLRTYEKGEAEEDTILTFEKN